VLSRRQWFAAAASGIAAIVGWRYASSDEQDGIVAVLRRRLDYLVLDEPGVRAFASDLAIHGKIHGSKLRLLDAARPIYERMPQSMKALALPLARRAHVTLYLMSSDFF
jgi:hypothetical protein